VIPLKEENKSSALIMATRRGLIKKTDMAEFASIRRGGKIALKIVEGDELVAVDFAGEGDDVLVASRYGKCIRFSESDVRDMGRNSQGVRSMKLSKEDYVVDMTVLREGYEMITVSENGYGKRCDANEYRVQGRAGKGIKAGVFNEKTGLLVNLKQVSENDDIMLIADNGVAIRIKATEISKISRGTQGVRIMKFRDDGKLVCVTTCVSEEEEEQTLEIAAENSTEEESDTQTSEMDKAIEEAEEEEI